MNVGGAANMLNHPKGVEARVLLTSVFGPYARDDKFGSRAINPMELYHNQVTREQGEFSLRMFHRSWGIMMIQANISAPSTLLDFPTREAFEREVADGAYDVIGISSIIPNIAKVREMCRLVRRLSPASVIVIGGHVTATPGIESTVSADHFVRGDGISWMRRYLGEDEAAPVRHPHIVSGFGGRTMGIRLPHSEGSTAATIIPSVGCPMGCNFCTTSAFFGGKGKFFNFYETGDELFDVMCEAEVTMKVQSFFIMDENFLLYRKRVINLLDRMRAEHKSWTLYVFSSANAIRKYSMAELVALGVSWVWLGLESPHAAYGKLQGADTVALVHELHSHGIKVLGSSIVGLEHHTPDNIRAELEHAASHNTDFHQFMLYTPAPGTPLYEDMSAQGRMLTGLDIADMHGQDKFNFEHAAISRDDSKRWLDWAFRHDFERNGPSLYRIMRTMLAGWKRYGHDDDPRLRARFVREARSLRSVSGALLWAMERRLKRTQPAISEDIRCLRKEIGREFGLLPRFLAMLAGPFVLWRTSREATRLVEGVTYEPQTFVDRRNWTSGPRVQDESSVPRRARSRHREPQPQPEPVHRGTTKVT